MKTQWKPIISEEHTYRGRGASLRHRMYAPAVDVAVGPFAIEGQLVEEYDGLLEQTTEFVEHLVSSNAANARRFGSNYPPPHRTDLRYANHNARCFLAIEVEKGIADPKHLLGSTINAVALGRVGVLVGWDDRRMNALLRLREYISMLSSLGKNAFQTANLLIVRPQQLLDAVEHL